MSPLARNLIRKFNYTDYLSWPDDERWEIIQGVAYNMTPAPGREHQRISFRLSGILYEFLKNKPCEAFAAPFDVRLSDRTDPCDEDIDTVIQPDLVVVCDQRKLDKRGCLGAPDITVEILSESTSYRDQTEKLMLYEKHGVKEYWIFNPDAQYAMIYALEGKKFRKPEYLTENDVLTSRVLEGFSVNLSDIWQ